MEAGIVTTHIGVIPTDPTHERYRIMQKPADSSPRMPTPSARILPLRQVPKHPKRSKFPGFAGRFARRGR